ncbi:YegP family protein [Paenarthrobacter sp. Z7-10]|nr:YegP family protein [Paenarthrobacter sp. Z7-10]
MAGYFELVSTPEVFYRLRMIDREGNLMAVSVTYQTREAAVAGIRQAREIAGTGHVHDCTQPQPPSGAPERANVVETPDAPASIGTSRTAIPAAGMTGPTAAH